MGEADRAGDQSGRHHRQPRGHDELDAFRAGARLGNRNALVRIKNITAAVPATFDLMHTALQQMRDDLGIIPQAIFMSGRSQRQLRDSLKTALIDSSDLPTEFENIPDTTPSHSIVNGEII